MNVEKKKKEVLKKIYGGKRKPYMHDYRLTDGTCKNCDEFIGDSKNLLCKIITREEVEEFTNYE